MKLFNLCLVFVLWCSVSRGIEAQDEVIGTSEPPRRKHRNRHAHEFNANASFRRNNNQGETDMESNLELEMDRAHLNKINEKLTEIASVGNQMLRKIENLEYKVTKMEVQFEEKTNGLKLDMKELARKVQQLDWNSGKTDQALDVLRSDTAFLKQAYEHARTYPFQDREPARQISSGSNELTNRMQAALRGIQLIQKDVSSMHTNLATMKTNVSNMYSSLEELQTSQQFIRSMVEFEKRNYPAIQDVCNAANPIIDQYPDLPMDCSEINSSISSVYRIMPAHSTIPFFVYCDMVTKGGGWTVIQRRMEGSVDFYRNWLEYKRGFGNTGREHWLGLEKIHLLTSTKINELYIELEDFSETQAYAMYDAFVVGSEIDGFAITYLGDYDGSAGDSLSYHAGYKFSTLDNDLDRWNEGSCAKSHEGAWWYNKCDASNLNGRYMTGELPELLEYQGMYWSEFKGSRYSLKSSKMMIRPKKS